MVRSFQELMLLTMNWRNNKTPQQYTSGDKCPGNNCLKELKELHEVQQGEVWDPAFEEWPMQCYMLRNTQLRSSFAEKSMCLPEMCPSSKGSKWDLLLQWCSWLPLHEIQRVEGGDSPPLSSGEVTPGVVGSVVGSSAQERQGHNEDCPEKGHKNDEKLHHFSYEARPILDANA